MCNILTGYINPEGWREDFFRSAGNLTGRAGSKRMTFWRRAGGRK